MAVEIEEKVGAVGGFSSCTLLGAVRRECWYSFREVCRGRVHHRGGAEQLQASKGVFVAYQAREGRETGFPVEANDVCGQEAVGNAYAYLAQEHH